MKKTLRPVSVAAIGLLAAGSTLAAPTAFADPVDADRGPVLDRVNSTRAAQAKVTDYWTADRMEAAKPLTVDPGPDFDREPVQTGEPRVIEGASAEQNRDASAEGEPFLGGPWTGGGAVEKTTGKVFFTLSGTDYVCSANAVESSNQSTVATAGHCVNDGAGEFASNFVFVPGYDHGEAPHGEWTATTLGTTAEWDGGEDFNYDAGFAVVESTDGSTLTDTVGSQSIGFNTERGGFLYSFGFPAAEPYDGEELDYCSSEATDDVNGTEDQRLDCNMTGGSSGGPWFADFSESEGTGVQVSVNSFGYTNEADAMYGPYFGSVIEELYNAAEAA